MLNWIGSFEEDEDENIKFSLLIGDACGSAQLPTVFSHIYLSTPSEVEQARPYVVTLLCHLDIQVSTSDMTNMATSKENP